MTSRLDGPAKVTGRAKYGADHNFPGMVHGYVVLSTIAHGEIRSMDVTAASGAPNSRCNAGKVNVTMLASSCPMNAPKHTVATANQPARGCSLTRRGRGRSANTAIEPPPDLGI